MRTTTDLIIRFIPKGTVVINISEEYIKELENCINNLLRSMFGFKSSLEIFQTMKYNI